MDGLFVINGKGKRLSFDPAASLADVLRANGHTEVKEGCCRGECGSCVVLLAGKLVNSCQVFAASAREREILTSRALGSVHDPHPIQEAFVEAGAVQCGFCTPGKTLATFNLLGQNPDPKDDEIREALNGVLCRCTGYVKIIDAVRLAGKRMRDHG
jgi:aerobic-type carbon monoxide dehydrogenase small subunit (CoxS/CutS family)